MGQRAVLGLINKIAAISYRNHSFETELFIVLESESDKSIMKSLRK